MDTEKTFRTKLGFCHILPDRIVLTNDGNVENVNDTPDGTILVKLLTIYGIMAGVFIYFAYDNYFDGQMFFSALFGLAALYLIYGIAVSTNNSAVSVIQRNAIKKVSFKKAIPFVTRSRFEVLFENSEGKTKKRLIMLPGSLTGGKGETEKALKIMKDENLLA
ncbi:phosphoribosylaminoimidazolesuccinocarboxamide synthase [Flavobacterium sp.]|uniref:phosphoribosylaminoimidazolesuccinocarboxamide synthase n=1 Tax=Flavobacterium sp. TaxID=239 RepID=UPI0040336B23